ncbi:MAG: hypothetical protein ACKOWF_02465 [Chloroflexota bacterium]
MSEDEQHAGTPATEPPPPDGPSFMANPAAWIRQNRAKAEILAIGAVSIGLIFCMMVLVAIGLWRTAGQ